ncbi:hypothetical protein HY384_04200 [Candidatus Daviesbacteria bacterium]|nr:hypothetical protein [Candidatus Daviesbacteria bacterium]
MLDVDNVLIRLIGQIRFRPNLISFDIASKAASEYENKFEEWLAEKSDDVTLYTPSEKKFLQIASDKITYLNESKKDFTELDTIVKKAFKSLNKLANLKKVGRIGVRATEVWSTNLKLNELKDIIFNKFYNQDKKLKVLVGESIKDAVFVLVSEQQNGLKSRVQIGPVNKQQAIKRFQANFSEEDNVDKLTDANLYVDIDVFEVENLTATNVEDKLTTAHKEVTKLLKEYNSYIFK